MNPVQYAADTDLGFTWVWLRSGMVLLIPFGWFVRDRFGKLSSHKASPILRVQSRCTVWAGSMCLVKQALLPSARRPRRNIVLTGDSAGGSLALVLLSIATAEAGSAGIAPMGAVVLSPVTDLALTGESFQTRAEADPYFVRPQVAGLVRSYLGESDPRNPVASPLYGYLVGLPPVRVHVGDDEVLLDDSRQYVKRAVAAGVDARLDDGRECHTGSLTVSGTCTPRTRLCVLSAHF
jgi:acetyl esterase/lipase